MQRIHFIAIGGSAMHSLAIALHKRGYQISGSDDEIYEPSKGKLDKYGLLPERIGWFPEQITDDIDVVLVGMHADNENPELQAAQEKNIQIYSYPEFFAELSRDKTRVVVAGSHGKTTITSILMHVLQKSGTRFDYLIGAQIDNYDTMARVTPDADLMIFEGDEYLSAPVDKTPKFLHYKPHIALITGIAWDHINAFPTFKNYIDQFRQFIQTIEVNGALVYFESDPIVAKLVTEAKENRPDIELFPYDTHPYEIFNDKTFLRVASGRIPLHVFGEHNMQNIGGAFKVYQYFHLSDEFFYKGLLSYVGTSKRLQKLNSDDDTDVYLDYAHSPSKLKATVNATRELHPERKIVACMELHTFSSLNPDFLGLYKGSMRNADRAIVYIDQGNLEGGDGSLITKTLVEDAFEHDDMVVVMSKNELRQVILAEKWCNSDLLLMSSSNFSGIDVHDLSLRVLQSKLPCRAEEAEKKN